MQLKGPGIQEWAREGALNDVDEPLSNLDAKLRIEMRNEIKKLHQRMGKTSVYVTHDQIEAMTLATRIAVMDNGHIRQVAEPATVYEEPADLFVASFMGSPPMNMLEGVLVRDGGMSVACSGEDEAALRFPLPEALARRVGGRDGAKVVLGLRPERSLPPVPRSRARTASSSKDRSRSMSRTGPDTMIVFEIAGRELIARVRPQDARPAGSPFRFEVEMRRAKLFDAESCLKL